MRRFQRKRGIPRSILDPARCSSCTWIKEQLKQRCADCLERHRLEMIATRQRKRREGICIDCSAPAELGRSYCRKHLDKYAARMRDKRQKPAAP